MFSWLIRLWKWTPMRMRAVEKGCALMRTRPVGRKLAWRNRNAVRILRISDGYPPFQSRPDYWLDRLTVACSYDP
jgi:hypothetical protein